VPAHYYQAELLLFSLKHFALHPKESIVVQCTMGVDKEFLSYLNNNGYNYHMIKPHLYGKYCNKVQQLDFFINQETTDVILIDTDTFFLEPINIPDPDKFSAKIVDSPNPALSTIKKIFKTAQLSLPPMVKTDWKTNEGNTIATNFNGGFYFIPARYVNTINTAWKKWSQWLFKKMPLFNDQQVFIHLDQLSMALAVKDTQLEYSILPSNFNCPVHNNARQRYYQGNKPILLIHYHKEINSFGVFNTAKASNIKIREALERANSEIISNRSFLFLTRYKKSLIKPPMLTENTLKLERAISKLVEDKRKLKLIIHAGTPKTGTTSLQFFFDKHREKFKSIGVLYPLPNSKTYEPKHQWLVHALSEKNVDMLISNFKKILIQADAETHTILLSTEGIYNHWYDYDQEAKSFLAVLKALFDLEMIICFRKPSDFAYSLYAQYVKNPRIEQFNCYGKDLSFAEMLDSNWFLIHLDYLSFIYQIEELLGKANLKVMKYSPSLIIKKFCEYIDIDLDYTDEINENASLTNSSIEILRIINRFPLDPELKNECLQLVKKINDIISPDNIFDAELHKKEFKAIDDLCLTDHLLLETSYGLDFNNK
jgi:hypothetical protein